MGLRNAIRNQFSLRRTVLQLVHQLQLAKLAFGILAKLRRSPYVRLMNVGLGLRCEVRSAAHRKGRCDGPRQTSNQDDVTSLSARLKGGCSEHCG